MLDIGENYFIDLLQNSRKKICLILKIWMENSMRFRMEFNREN